MTGNLKVMIVVPSYHFSKSLCCLGCDCVGSFCLASFRNIDAPSSSFHSPGIDGTLLEKKVRDVFSLMTMSAWLAVVDFEVRGLQKSLGSRIRLQHRMSI